MKFTETKDFKIAMVTGLLLSMIVLAVEAIRYVANYLVGSTLAQYGITSDPFVYTIGLIVAIIAYTYYLNKWAKKLE